MFSIRRRTNVHKFPAQKIKVAQSFVHESKYLCVSPRCDFLESQSRANRWVFHH
jgi:hypothetical protein